MSLHPSLQAWSCVHLWPLLREPGGAGRPSFFLTPPPVPLPTSLQENFELNHETLYLAVKLVDHYLVEVVSMRDKLQLIGSTAILIASKFEVTPRALSWGAGAEGAVPFWSPWVVGEGQVPVVPGHCPESCWGSMSVLVFPSCKQGLELEPRAGAIQTAHKPHWVL